MISPYNIGIIAGKSMSPTYRSGMPYIGTTEFTEIKREDVIVAYSRGLEEMVIKRVIGLPGETINIENGEIFIDGIYYEKEGGCPNAQNRAYPITLQEDEYFLMGDNRLESIDSRNGIVGNIKREDIKRMILTGGELTSELYNKWEKDTD